MIPVTAAPGTQITPRLAVSTMMVTSQPVGCAAAVVAALITPAHTTTLPHAGTPPIQQIQLATVAPGMPATLHTAATTTVTTSLLRLIAASAEVVLTKMANLTIATAITISAPTLLMVLRTLQQTIANGMNPTPTHVESTTMMTSQPVRCAAAAEVVHTTVRPTLTLQSLTQLTSTKRRPT